MAVYTLFKFLHVAAVIVWIGSMLTLGVLQARLVRARDRDALLALSTHAGFFGRAFVGPSALVTLIAGVVMVIISGLSFGALWITWGFIGIFVSMALGGGFSRRIAEKLNTLVETVELDDPRVLRLQKRLTVLNIINMLILFSVVWAMVFKPTL